MAYAMISFVSGQIYVDKKAKGAFRNSAQGLITFATYGVGMLIGSFVSGSVTENFQRTINGSLNYMWQSIWLVPAGIALATGILFMFFSGKGQCKHLKIKNRKNP